MKNNDLATLIKLLDLTGQDVVIVDDDICHKIQMRLLDVLDDIISVCDKYHVRWQMSGGSALGTIRHKGFIPWDDDIDINMERKELERFIPLFKKHFESKYYIYVLGETENYNYMMVHIMTKDVKARALMEDDRLPSGLCVDVFSIDNVPDGKIARKIHGVSCMIYRYALSCLRFQYNAKDIGTIAKNNPEIHKIERNRGTLAKMFNIIPEKWWTVHADRCCRKYVDKPGKMVTILAGTKKYFGEMYPREEFCRTKEAVFEGRKVQISEYIEQYMEQLYGKDYMVIPPKEKRGRHVYMELDIDALEQY